MPSLPFLYRARLVELGGSVVTENGAPVIVNCSVWPTSSRRVGPSGTHYDYEGEAEIRYFDLMRDRNRGLLIGNTTYRIQSATKHEYLPHVALTLLESPRG